MAQPLCLATGASLNEEGPELPLTRPQYPARIGRREAQISAIRLFLETLSYPPGLTPHECKRFARAASEFFVCSGKLWKRSPSGQHQQYVADDRRMSLIKEAHDNLGHKGIFTVRNRLLARFWWPSLDFDVKWYVRTCHKCQTRQMRQILIPPTVAFPLSLFRCVHIDTMKMPKYGTFSGIIQARCALSGYPEWRKVSSESAKAVGSFIFESILCRWGAVEEIISDNGTAYVTALDYLKEQYRINHIRVSPYNSRANGVVENRHLGVRESIVKSMGDSSNWTEAVHSVFWAERTAIQKATGYLPYYLVHGVEPLFPFDLKEATYLVDPPDAPMLTTKLISRCARQLQKRPEDLEYMCQVVHQSRLKAARRFEAENVGKIVDYNFELGSLVLVQNSQVKKELNHKTKPLYFGPMVVICRTTGGSYILAEVDGSLSRLCYAAFRVIPYKPRSQISLPVTELVEKSTEELNEMIEDELDEEPDNPVKLDDKLN